MTNEQAKRLDEAIAKAGLNWWQVQRQVGFDVFNDVVAIEKTIAIIEKMAKTEEVEEAGEKEMTTGVKVLTMEDAEKAVATYMNEEITLEKETENGKLVKIIKGDTVTTYAIAGTKTHKTERNINTELRHKTIDDYIEFLLLHGFSPVKEKAMIYIRGSEEEKQYRTCKEYAKKHDLDVIDVTTDFGRIAERIVNGEIDIVLVYDYTRLTRNAEEYKQREHQLRGYGVTIIAAN